MARQAFRGAGSRRSRGPLGLSTDTVLPLSAVSRVEGGADRGSFFWQISEVLRQITVVFGALDGGSLG